LKITDHRFVVKASDAFGFLLAGGDGIGVRENGHG
jgi:hypothetical protein